MGLWQRIKALFTRRKKQEEWANRFDQPPAKPTHPTPLDPANDPWRT